MAIFSSEFVDFAIVIPSRRVARALLYTRVTMAFTRRLFLERFASTAGAAMTYEAMAALGLVALPDPAHAFALQGPAPAGTDGLTLGAGGAGMSTAYALGKLGYKLTIR